MEKYNIVSTKNVVKTGISRLDKEIDGLFIGDSTIVFGADTIGIEMFLNRIREDSIISTDIDCRHCCTLKVFECLEKADLPIIECDVATNIFQITARGGKHFVYVWKNRMKGICDFECELI